MKKPARHLIFSALALLFISALIHASNLAIPVRVDMFFQKVKLENEKSHRDVRVIKGGKAQIKMLTPSNNGYPGTTLDFNGIAIEDTRYDDPIVLPGQTKRVITYIYEPSACSNVGYDGHYDLYRGKGKLTIKKAYYLNDGRIVYDKDYNGVGDNFFILVSRNLKDAKFQLGNISVEDPQILLRKPNKTIRD